MRKYTLWCFVDRSTDPLCPLVTCKLGCTSKGEPLQYSGVNTSNIRKHLTNYHKATLDKWDQCLQGDLNYNTVVGEALLAGTKAVADAQKREKDFNQFFQKAVKAPS